MISENTIQKVRDHNILSVLQSLGLKFTRRGSNHFAHCPFHSERTPSFSVTEGKNLFYCQSCHKGGDAIRFVQERDGADFSQAVETIAKACNIPIEYVNSEKSDEQREAARQRESMFIAVELIQNFFVEQLRQMTDEARAARDYAYNRWPEEFCSQVGIGLAPADTKLFLDYCKRKAISEDLLLQLGILKKDSQRGYIYPMFRKRLTIPIRERLGRVIGFTARYLGDDKADKVGKYINSANSTLYSKSDSIFGIDKASRCREADYFNIVEGAPDVLRLQCIGLNNTVASLGTAWTDSQFEQLMRHTSSLCFIPDTDVPKDDKPFGPGFEAVIKNGSKAITKGFHVTVRELPFRYYDVRVPLFDFELEEAQELLLEEKRKEAKAKGMAAKNIREISLSQSEINSITRQRIIATFTHKNDADEYILSQEIYSEIPETNFIIWLAEKRFYNAKSQAEENKYVAEIAELLRFVKDPLLFDQCIEAIAKIHGKPKLWRGAVERAKGEARTRAKEIEPQSERERDIELLKRFNLTIRDNCYYTFDGDDEPTRLSNFILVPLFHIEDESNGTRLFRLRNQFGYTREIELRESELCSLSAFSQRVGSLGNFVWRAKVDKLNNVKEYTYAKTNTAKRINKLGWDVAEEFFAFGNGIFVDGKFRRVDDLGVITDIRGSNYYIPATSRMYANNPERFQFERLMVHENTSGISLRDFAERLAEVFGDQSKIALCYLLSTIFRDIIYSRTRHFPILNLFGEKGSGKTTLATCLQAFFQRVIEPPSIGVTSVPAMNDRVSQAVNTMVVFDEYRNDLDVRKIQFLKGMWGGGGQTKKNTNSDGMATQTIVSTGVAVCGQDKPTQDMALFTRLIFLQYNRTVFSGAEQNRCANLVAVCNMGLTHLTLQVLQHRAMFAKNFAQTYSLVKSELSTKTDGEEIHSRIFGNWIIPLATFRVLETVLDLPFSYAEIFDIALKGMRNQNEYAKESSEVADFWNTLQGMHSAGRCVENSHFRIRYLRSFRSLSMREDMIFSEAKPILYLNAAAVAALFNGNRGANATANRSNWSTILSYLKSHPSFLGLKQDRFVILTPQGTPDYIIEAVGGAGGVKKQKVNRPKALCFDYSQLKEAFGLTLETEVLTEAEEFNEDIEPQPAATKSQPPKESSLFNDTTEDVPF